MSESKGVINAPPESFNPFKHMISSEEHIKRLEKQLEKVQKNQANKELEIEKRKEEERNFERLSNSTQTTIIDQFEQFDFDSYDNDGNDLKKRKNIIEFEKKLQENMDQIDSDNEKENEEEDSDFSDSDHDETTNSNEKTKAKTKRNGNKNENNKNGKQIHSSDDEEEKQLKEKELKETESKIERTLLQELECLIQTNEDQFEKIN